MNNNPIPSLPPIPCQAPVRLKWISLEGNPPIFSKRRSPGHRSERLAPTISSSLIADPPDGSHAMGKLHSWMVFVGGKSGENR